MGGESEHCLPPSVSTKLALALGAGQRVLMDARAGLFDGEGCYYEAIRQQETFDDAAAVVYKLTKCSVNRVCISTATWFRPVLSISHLQGGKGHALRKPRSNKV